MNNNSVFTEVPEAEIREYIGKIYGPFVAREPINRTMVLHWCDAMGHPMPEDDECVPAATLQIWLMRGLDGQWGEGSSAKDSFEVLSYFDRAGYEGIVAVNSKQDYLHPLRYGDLLQMHAHVDSISEQKQTALGEGYFVTMLQKFYNQDNVQVAEMLFRMLKYKPAKSPPIQQPSSDDKTTSAKRMRPIVYRDNQFFWDAVKQGHLAVQQCLSCQRLRHPPGPRCPSCHSDDWQALKSSGKGHIYSFVIVHHPPVPPFDYPFPVALVELEEGWRIIAQLKDIEKENIHIGMAVQLECIEIEDDLYLPFFTAADTD